MPQAEATASTKGDNGKSNTNVATKVKSESQLESESQTQQQQYQQYQQTQPKSQTIDEKKKDENDTTNEIYELGAKDPLLAAFGISLKDEQTMINLASKKMFDLVGHMCEIYPSLYENGKLLGRPYAQLIGKLIELSKNNQSNASNVESQMKEMQKTVKEEMQKTNEEMQKTLKEVVTKIDNRRRFHKGSPIHQYYTHYHNQNIPKTPKMKVPWSPTLPKIKESTSIRRLTQFMRGWL